MTHTLSTIRNTGVRSQSFLGLRQSMQKHCYLTLKNILECQAGLYTRSFGKGDSGPGKELGDPELLSQMQGS